MTKYLISFPGFTMDHIAEEDFPAMRVAAHAVIMEANDAGECIFGGGIDAHTSCGKRQR